MKTKLPSVREVAAELRDINPHVEGECDVRLQVHPDGVWRLHVGEPSYIKNHAGRWGASSIPGVVRGIEKRFNSIAVAQDLIAQARDWGS